MLLTAVSIITVELSFNDKFALAKSTLWRTAMFLLLPRLPSDCLVHIPSLSCHTPPPPTAPPAVFLLIHHLPTQVLHHRHHSPKFFPVIPRMLFRHAGLSTNSNHSNLCRGRFHKNIGIHPFLFRHQPSYNVDQFYLQFSVTYFLGWYLSSYPYKESSLPF